jgi:hypothetical protein
LGEAPEAVYQLRVELASIELDIFVKGLEVNYV